MAVVAIVLPNIGFDPTEVAVPWAILANNNHKIVFFSEDGSEARADERMLNGRGIGPFGKILRANKNGRLSYQSLVESGALRNCKTYSDLATSQYDALVLPGGHVKSVIPYLESLKVQRAVSDAFLQNKFVAAICHGVLVVARSKNNKNGKSCLWGKRTTALLRKQEMLAWQVSRAWAGDYYLTYRTPVEDEVRLSLRESSDFISGPLPIWRDSLDSLSNGFVVRDGNYISARWPGDAHRFAMELNKALIESV